MTLENNEDFITAPFNSFPNCVGNRLGGGLPTSMTAANLQFFAADLQCIAWVKKKARVCVPFSGDCSRLGPPKPWARTLPEPREIFTSVFLLLLVLLPLATCKDDANHQNVSINFAEYAFLDDK